MNVLYKGNYYKRFEGVCKLISGNSVTELCFGDTIIADYCSKNKVSWKGFDINKSFVDIALKKHLLAQQNDLNVLEKFPVADTCIISGSLYHFHNQLENLFTKMLNSSNTIIISEPIINLSNRKGIIGTLARASAKINGEKQSFRYTEQSLLEALNNLKSKLNFSFKIVERYNKDILILIEKCPK